MMSKRTGVPSTTSLLALLTACVMPPTDATPPVHAVAMQTNTEGIVLRSQADADAACEGHPVRAPTHLTITGAGIRNLDGLHCIASVEHGLSIHDAPHLERLDGLDGTTDVGGLSLAHLPMLQDTGGLAALARVSGDIGIWDVPSLPALSLPALLWVEGDILVQDAPSLSQVDDLRALGGLQGGLLLHGEGVADLSGLEHLGRVLGAVHLTGLRGPSALDGLGRLADVGTLHIEGADGVTDVGGLAGLRRVRGDLILEDLPDLYDLDGLHGLRQVDGAVILAGLPSLPAGEVDSLRDALATTSIVVVVD